MYYVYILSNWDDSVLYIGVTSNLQLTKWQREKKNNLIISQNPLWKDLSETL